MLVELVTKSGYHFWGESFAVIDGEDYALDEMTPQQRDYVLAVRDVNALNAAFAGKAEFRAEGLPEFAEVFPQLAGRCSSRKKEKPLAGGQTPARGCVERSTPREHIKYTIAGAD